jgi:FKBP-type peptidyl-prolyl cis-trans isomerase SlyD
VGITVFHKEGAGSVAEAVALVARGEAREFGQTHTCGGGGSGGCGGHGHNHHAPVVREPIEGKADVQNDRVVTIHFTLKDPDGTELDSSAGGEPLAYLHGRGTLVAGLEGQLEGLEAGDQKTIAVDAANAYGERDESKITEVPLEEIPPNPEVGAVLYAREQDGSTIALTVVDIGDTHATLDLNHPLAGRDLVFEVTIVKVEKATEEELARGHVH